MKRWLTLLISFLILAVPVSSLAAPASLSRVSSSGAAISEGTVQVISYKAYIKVHSDIIQTDASLIIKNTSDEEESKMMVGMPLRYLISAYPVLLQVLYSPLILT
jgi:hypothetical protein